MNADRTVPWSCRTVRAWRALVAPPARPPADRSVRSGLIARHTAGCVECQRYFARTATLESALRSSAAERTATAPDDLHRRIMQAVADARPTASARRRVPTPVFVGLSAAVALAAIIAMIQTRETMLPRRTLRPPVVVAPRDAKTAPSATAAAPAPNAETSPFAPTPPAGEMEPLDRFAPVASALAQDPLQSEVDSVYADARYAVHFLALNFLPAGALADNRRMPDSDLRRGGG